MSTPAKGITRREMISRAALTGVSIAGIRPLGLHSAEAQPKRVFKAGAFAIDITPRNFPISVNGMLNDRIATQAHDPLYARILILEEGFTRIALIVCDSLMIDRPTLDVAKYHLRLAARVPDTRMMICSTHTHSAPSVVDIFQSKTDEKYREFLVNQLAKGAEVARRRLQPAKLAWAQTDDPTQTFCRMWILKKPATNPFGQVVDRAVMHPGYQNPDCIEPAGPRDTALALLSCTTMDDRPLALFANYTMHYAEDRPYLSADYFGEFAREFARLIGEDRKDSSFVAMMSNGAQGDAHCFDYSQPQVPRSRKSVAQSVAHRAFETWKTMDHQPGATILMRQEAISLKVKKPGDDELRRARATLRKCAGRELQGWAEVYAGEISQLSQFPEEVEMKLQAIRIGGFALATMPVEAYAVTGLAIKARSALPVTCVVDLANGYNGYMAPPEQHEIGGYSTWLARSCYLEDEAAPKVVERLGRLLEEVSHGFKLDRPRLRELNAYQKSVLAGKPIGFWPLDDLEIALAANLVPTGPRASFAARILPHLDGPSGTHFPGLGQMAKAVYCFEDRIAVDSSRLGSDYSISFWCCNRMPEGSRPVCGYLFSRGANHAPKAPGDHLGIGGTATRPGCLFIYNGDASKTLLTSEAGIETGKWHHVTLVRHGGRVHVFLDGALKPVVSGNLPITFGGKHERMFLAGRSDDFSNFEGKLCMAALFDRPLSPEEIHGHYLAATKPS